MLSMLLDLGITNKNKYGTKASALGELMKSGVQVPNGFALSSEFEPIVNHVKGVIVESGSPFDHLGILAREMNIPVIYNVKNAMSILKEGDEALLDGFVGEVKIIKK
ncbi:hypothetical protein G9F71_019325 [Clostridium sp. FP2]|uniref:PEP-utilizing enzyme n=1 Tax=Clostridium TaxID=1485 RepID=UPI0013E91F93|nr:MULTISPECIES: PEP-utilizing enzyme [Clostridium]MBW9156628.1 hypothetical protein [Clostridium tagluense]MBZ9624996.1 hypothetical protein [Clostridium sp. FP2]WLC64795.1 hypothetical protein KTC93_18405 [Clostridium tagluense]